VHNATEVIGDGVLSEFEIGFNLISAIAFASSFFWHGCHDAVVRNLSDFFLEGWDELLNDWGHEKLLEGIKLEGSRLGEVGCVGEGSKSSSGCKGEESFHFCCLFKGFKID
jgi:hypothetical protein